MQQSRPDLAAIRGREMEKRVIEIAAMGRHAVLFIANHGQGKTMLIEAGQKLRSMLIATVPGGPPANSTELWAYEKRPKGETLHNTMVVDPRDVDMVVRMADLNRSDWFLPPSAESTKQVVERSQARFPACLANQPSKGNPQGVVLDMVPDARSILGEAYERFPLSPGAAWRVQRLATTIAIMDGSDKMVKRVHIAEALSYQLQGRDTWRELVG